MNKNNIIQFLKDKYKCKQINEYRDYYSERVTYEILDNKFTLVMGDEISFWRLGRQYKENQYANFIEIITEQNYKEEYKGLKINIKTYSDIEFRDVIEVSLNKNEKDMRMNFGLRLYEKLNFPILMFIDYLSETNPIIRAIIQEENCV